MTVQTITPSSKQDWLKARTEDITSTEVSALFGISPYTTAFELWHRKHDGFEVEFDQNERVKWGTRLQDAIAAGVAEEQGWTIRRMDEYLRVPDLRIGASFDFSICQHKTDGLGKAVEGEPEQDGLLEIKNVDSLQYKYGWLVDGDDVQAPPHIEIQVQHQLLVSDRAFVYIAALIGGNRIALIRREPDPVVIDAIKKKVAEFWASIDANKPPAPNLDVDAKFIAKLYGYAEVGKVYQAEGDNEIQTIAKRYKELGDAVKSCETERDSLKAQILIKIGDAEKVLGGEFTISAGMIGPAKVEYDRQGYRSFKISWKKK